MLADTFREIESPRHDTFLNLASGLRIFKELLQESRAVSSLIEYIGDNLAEKDNVQERIQKLLLEENNLPYIHPQDSAIASYLFAVSRTDNNLASELAIYLLGIAHLWWTNLLAADLIKSMNQTSI